MQHQYSTQMEQKSLMQLRSEYEGETFSGKVVDANPAKGENPIISPAPDIPNIIVNGESAAEWNEGDRIKLVKVTDVKKNESTGTAYMFGERIQTDNERQEQKAENYQVTLTFMGNEMTSDTYREEQDAEDLKQFLESQVNFGTIEITRTK